MAFDHFDDRIDQAYNVRRALPDHATVFARWRADAEACIASRPDASLDLPYGTDPLQRLDLFPPVSVNPQKKAPFVMLIHGGYWQALDKADTAHMAQALCDAGFAVAVINYRLCPKVGLTEICDDVEAALGWLLANAPTLGLDPTRGAAIGHSAGAHLAAMLAIRVARDAARTGIMRYLGLVSGVYELAPLIQTRINANLGLDLDLAHRLSPTRAFPEPGLSLDLMVGGSETSGFFDQHRQLMTAWEASTDLQHRIIDGEDHLSLWEALSQPDSILATTLITRMKAAFGAR